MQRQRQRGLLSYGGGNPVIRSQRGRGSFHHRGRRNYDRGANPALGGYQQDYQQLALKVAENHQCNNLSFETNDPATKDSRIYVGNVCKLKVDRSALFIIFSKYGTITAISHLTCKSAMDHCSFAFIQYTTTIAAEKAVEKENGQGYYGYSLEVKLAEFKNSDPHQSTNGDNRTSRYTPRSASLFNKRPSSERSAPFASPAKRSKVPSVGTPDILVCGSCHMMFDNLEAIILHKRTPCKSIKKCRCADEKIPDVLTCAMCAKQLSTPWQLVSHIHKIHGIKICNDLSIVDRGADNEIPEVNEDVNEEEFVVDEIHGDFDLDNDLLEEEDEDLEGQLQ